MVEIRHLNPEGDWAEGVARLYRLEGWLGEDSPTGQISEAIKNSHCAYGAFDGQKMVGFFRAISDKVSDSYLIDLVVDPEYRGQGLGVKLTEALVAHLKKDGIEWITAISTPAGIRVYPKVGKVMEGHVPFRF